MLSKLILFVYTDFKLLLTLLALCPYHYGNVILTKRVKIDWNLKTISNIISVFTDQELTQIDFISRKAILAALHCQIFSGHDNIMRLKLMSALRRYIWVYWVREYFCVTQKEYQNRQDCARKLIHLELYKRLHFNQWK